MIVSTLISSLVAGDTLKLTVGMTDYPATDGWSMKLCLTRDGTALLAVDGVPNGVDFDITISAAASASLAPGRAEVFLVFTKDSERYTVSHGSLAIVPNPLVTMTPTSTMSALAACNATIALIVAQPEATANFNGQSYTLQNIRDLYEIRNALAAAVAAELASMGVKTKPSFKQILTRFR